jgi:hypothetical protein
MGGNVTEYRVTILFSIQMTDMLQSQTIYDNKSLMISEPYSPGTENPEKFSSIEQAIERIYERAFESVIRSTLESW